MNKTKYTFTGAVDSKKVRRHPDSPKTPEPYKADPKLVQAVNLAIYLGRPLLLEGEAGSGKTRLARAVAYDLGLPLYVWNVRSASKAQEGLYSYDSILRLHDVHLKQIATSPKRTARQTKSSARRDPSKPADYVTWGALGKAFQVKESPAVVLIDEIDKADLDFPNDLLTVLDEPWEFAVPEMEGKVIKAAHKPIVIITSNKEKGNLPAPFLRRCIYYFVEFPEDEQQLRDIVDLHYRLRDTKPPPSSVLSAATNRFLTLRRSGGLQKKPGTSEFLDWIDVLGNFDSQANKVQRIESPQLAYPELLLKLRVDWQRRDMAS